ncbi:hypothetical protein NUJ30_08485 [Burkholderia contaminans]|uniref:hypothetical protein n=1 Tax=Burkholderia TaxID=32008 RepID=UPI0010F4CE19|nr:MULTISPECIES: hypothetical protein [Burkholderia]MBD1412848.1 hypothetical protein [Burkholderia contaminans]UXZ68701.1 hypothetical protein NUJ29_08490 [Burkholderia contaminans]UXZ76462.1 hypothetical protein NUJ30_08485 [Burkholderia contaminans]
MYQIDVSTAVSTQPTSTALGTPGYFTDGNAALGQAATVVPAEFLNSLMLEVMNAITGAGLTLNKSSFNQLYTAIRALSQGGGATYAVDTGSANTYQVSYSPGISAVVDGMKLRFKAKTANTGASTFSPNGLAASPIYSGAHSALLGGEIVANSDVEVVWNSSLNSGNGAWVLLESTGGVLEAATPPQFDNSAKLATTSYVIGAISGKNRIINPRFQVNQRNYVSGSALASGAYGLDRWKASTANSSMTFTYSPAGQPVTIVGSFQQVIEQGNVEAGTYTLSWTGTAQARVYNSGASAPSYSASPITVALDGTQNVIVEFNAGTVDFVQMESGPNKTAFERRPFATELSLCLRYFEASQVQTKFWGFSGINGVTLGQAINFMAWKRVSPTIATIGVTYAGCTGLTLEQIGATGMSFYITNTTTTASSAVSFYYTASAEL